MAPIIFLSSQDKLKFGLPSFRENAKKVTTRERAPIHHQLLEGKICHAVEKCQDALYCCRTKTRTRQTKFHFSQPQM
jgi:hypothetical protein